ncbi:MAG: phosphoglucomutase/phosphomannomutase family protein [Trueperaceae bacterium]|nr:phosphoglucomutase/phosphomannomutase family protein [Trueperaceae bacterium]
MDTLVFGTDGWRDIIGDKFTFENVSRASQAYADYLRSQGAKTVVVGHDTRFNGDRFARRAAEVLAANGLKVYLSNGYIPTPALSFAVKHLEAGGGLMLTASHNPPPYHGFKLKGPYGGTATQAIYQAMSEPVPMISYEDVKPFHAKHHVVESFDIREAYYEALTKLVDVKQIEKVKGEIVHEAMGGAGTGWLSGFFSYAKLSKAIKDLHEHPDPMFYGVNPEPIHQNLKEAMDYMRDKSEGIVLATDGDADRLGAVLPGGVFFNSHQIFAVLLKVLHQKGVKGRVVKTFTVSRVVERLAAQLGYDVTETPVGFKYIVDAMLEGQVAIGGEESGGIGVAGHIPERDGMANSLLLLEAMAQSGKGMAELFSEIEAQVGWKHAYDRLDLHLSGNELKDAVLASLKNPLSHISNRQIESVERLDGIKLNLSGNAWLMFRASGTEPVLRIYCEAASKDEVNQILEGANAFVENVSLASV